MQGNDAFGFSVLPAGFRDLKGSFGHLGQSAFFWSSTTSGKMASRWNFFHDSDVMQRMPINKEYVFSIRCIKN